MKKFISWNVNGLRACMGKRVCGLRGRGGADLLALQGEMQRGQADVPLEGISSTGTARNARATPARRCSRANRSVAYGMAHGDARRRGRVLTLEYRNSIL